MFNYFEEQQHTEVIGSFTNDREHDFKNDVKEMLEGFRSAYSMDAIDEIVKVLKVDTIKEDYKQRLIGDILNENQFADDRYLAMHPDKLEQLFENTALEIVAESSVGQLAPIVGISLPVLKKNYLQCHSKDIVMTEIPSKPIVKVAFERKFLKDKDGTKYYLPDVFYDDTYKTVLAKAQGKPIPSTWYPTSGTLPIQDLNILTEAGGSIQTRDSLAYDFRIDGVKITVMNNDPTPASYVKTLTGLNIVPDMGNKGSFSYRVKTTNDDGSAVEEVIAGEVDFYTGLVTVTTSGDKIQQVLFSGHLSNENNMETVELDRERENLTWQIPDGQRINTGLTIEKIRDYKALFNIDITTDIIAEISTILTQFEDSSILSYLDTSLAIWKTRTDMPFGYNDGFIETYSFSATPPSNVFITPAQWVDEQLKYNLNREIDQLKVKLRTNDIMFVMYAHPNNISLIMDQVKWVIDEDTKVGGIQLDYRFGVMAANKNRIHVVSSLKINPSAGFRIVAYPTSKEVITFKHYKYSLNIENVYRNPFTPLTPNVMGTSRYITTEVLPVQGEMTLTNNDFGRTTGS